MIDVTTIHHQLLANVEFERPIFDWQATIKIFFELIYDEFSAKITVTPQDFRAGQGAASLADLWVEYRILGSNSRFVLFADHFEAHFENLTDDEFVINSFKFVITRLLPKLKLKGIRSIKGQSLAHLEFDEKKRVSEFLKEFRLEINEKAFEDLKMSLEPQVKFSVLSKDKNLAAVFSLERSLALSNGIFVNYDARMTKIKDITDFDSILSSFTMLYGSCMNSLGLDTELLGANNE